MEMFSVYACMHWDVICMLYCHSGDAGLFVMLHAWTAWLSSGEYLKWMHNSYSLGSLDSQSGAIFNIIRNT